MGARRRGGGQEKATAPYPGKSFFFCCIAGAFLLLFHYAGAFLLLLSLCRGLFCPCGESFWAAPPFLRRPLGINVPSLPPRTAVCSPLFFFKKILYTPRVFHCLCTSFTGINDKSALLTKGN